MTINSFKQYGTKPFRMKSNGGVPVFVKMTSSSLTLQLVLLLLLSCFPGYLDASVRPTAIRLQNNGYKGILLAIHPSVPQDQYLIDDIKDMFIDGSPYLHTATHNRAFFEEVTILVPNTWTSNAAWGPATTQLYQNADIIMQAPPTKRRRRSADHSSSDGLHTRAYTRSFGGCGQPAVRINLFTDMFGARGKYTFGPSGRLLVHEWAHFRWGVFDEYAQEGESQFYYSPTTGKLEAVRCNVHMVGRIYKKNPTTGRAEICTGVNPQTGVYDEGCMYSPYTRGHFNDNITASIMDRQQVPTITQFCNDDQNDKKRIHNYESPSRHNRLCGSRSTWAVITESDDFRAGKNPPRQVADMTPKITVVRSANHRQVILAVDSSGSMQEQGKLRQARQAATTLIEDGLDDETSAGVISFASTAKISSPIKKMDSSEVRQNATKSLPLEGVDGTNLAAGILKSLQMMNRNETNSTDTFLVVFTDGVNTADDNLDLALKEVIRLGVVVNVVAFSDKANTSLIKAVSDTGGRFYFDNNQEKSTSAVDGVLDIFSLMDLDRDKHPVNILSRAKAINAQLSMTGHFQIDRTLGCKTSIVVTYDEAVPKLVVRSPTGRKYASIYPEYAHNSVQKRIKIEIPKLAEVGIWSYSLTSETSEYVRVSILVLSKPRSRDVSPLQITGAIWMVNNTWPLRCQISAELIRDGVPVPNIKVKAVVDRPYTDPTELRLHDGGAGADAVKGDGVYSRYFNVFSTSGHYSVRLEAIDNTPEAHGEAVVMATAHAGSMYIESPFLPSADDFGRQGMTLSRVKHKDEMSPMRITDLRILHTSHANSTVVLSWTAPGDDDDWDKASSYTTAVGHTVEDITSSYTIAVGRTVEDMIRDKDVTLLDPTAVIKGNLNSPQSFGEVEQMKIKLDFLPANNISLVFAVYALDESGNKGDISNFVTAGFGFVPDFSSKDYLEEEKDCPELVKVAPRKQRVMIAVVVGVFAGILSLTVIAATVFCVFFQYKKKQEDVHEMKKVSKIV